MNHPLIYSFAVCGVSIALEAFFAGRGIKARLAELRVPHYAPPLWGWIVIGAFYYLICFAILYRLFASPETGPSRRWALVLLGSMMFINALWNYFFFRTRNLLHAYLIGFPYSLIAVMLFALLLRIDKPAAFCLLPYLAYLFYANAFGYRVWKLNDSAAL
jgi:translocator protein